MTARATTSGSAVAQVGQEVVLHVGSQEIPAVVVEDRGPLGIDGEQIVRVRVPSSEGEEPDEFEIPASALTW